MSLESETHFGLALLNQTPVDESVVLSPLSVSLALALVHAGAEGNTRDEIRNALAKGSTDEQLIEHYKAVGAALLKDSQVLVRIANRMFIRDGFDVKTSYLENISKNFAAKAETLNFDDAAASADTVNGFVKEVTAEKITELVKPDTFKDAVALLVNAIYLEAEWQSIFYTGSLQEGDFHVREGVTKKVEYLTDREVRRLYAETDEVQVLTLNYKDDSYKFTIILPKEKFGLAKFRAGLTVEKLQGLLNSVETTYINISFPKFKIEKETDLTKVLQKVGITEVFSDQAHLEGIAPNLKVSEAKHKAVIEVDEWGTKAAAATSFQMVLECALMTRPKDFQADRPFIFLVSHKNHILFEGQFFS